MSQNYIISNGELYHYGVKGMKWGVRRAQKRAERKERKAAKKEVNLLMKTLRYTSAGSTASSGAAIASLAKDDYEKAARMIDSGRLAVKTTFKKNIAEKSVDIYVGKSATPIMRARVADGERCVVDFVNENDSKNAKAFTEYYYSRYS